MRKNKNKLRNYKRSESKNGKMRKAVHNLKNQKKKLC